MATVTSAVMLSACSTGRPGKGVELLEEASFQTELDGEQTGLYTLTNSNGMTVQFTNFGARIVSLWVPSADGMFKDVVWGFPDIQGYLRTKDNYCGPIVGRYGNRIGRGRFSIDGKEYQLPVNENGNQLHGGKGGFSTKVWKAEYVKDPEGNRVLEMKYFSPDGEEGYPGNLKICVRYSLTDANELVIDYEADTDLPTVINPTSHVYFNLHGTSEKSTDSHILTIYAGNFTPTDEHLIPTGEIMPVDGTPMDFRTPKSIGKDIGSNDFEAIRFGNGYDHNWALDKPEKFTLAAEVYEPSTGVEMKIYTDQPGLQFYAGQGMDGKEVGKRGDRHNYRSGIALETQNYPDAPNHENSPPAILRPGETYTQHTIYAFDVR